MAVSDLPSGFVLDQAPAGAALPPGFVLDQQSSPGMAATALDAAKQLGSGIAEGVAAIPSTVPRLMNLAGEGVGALMQKYAPSLIDPEKEERQQQLSGYLSSQPGLSQYLPEPQTGMGEAARTVGNFLPSAATLPGSLTRNAVGAVASGLGAYEAGQAAPDEQSKPYMELGGALLAGGAGLRSAESIANRLAARGVPPAADIIADAKNTYQGIQAGTIKQPITQDALNTIQDDLKDALNRYGPRRSVAGPAHAAVDEIKIPGTKGAPDVADLVAARQNIKGFYDNPLPDPNKAAASVILPKLEAAIDYLSPNTMAALKNADANYSSGMTSNRLDARVQRAELRAAGDGSGMNLGNKIRQNSANMVLSGKESRGLSPIEEQQLKDVNKGTFTQNGLRLASNMLGGGGGMHGALMGMAGIGAGYETGHPELAALPILGMGLRGLANRSIANQAANVGATIRARSPYAQGLGVVGPSARMTPAALAAFASIPGLRALLPQLQAQGK